MVCDALVVAAGTVRAENYDALRLTAPGRAWRTAHGLPEFPLMVIVSGSLDLDPDAAVFADAPIRPIVVTHAGAPADRRRRRSPRSRRSSRVGDERGRSGRGAWRELHARGATQLLCEGGPHLFGALIAADLVDELCLTVSPLLVGGGRRPDRGRRRPARRGGCRCAHVLRRRTHMLFLRYARG